MFCSKIKGQVRSVLKEFDQYVDEHIDTALKVTVALKNILSSPVTDIITAIIPGDLDNTIKTQLINALTKAIEALSIADICKQYAEPADMLSCFVQQVKQRDPQLQDAILQKLASLVAGQMDGNKLQQSLYDLYTQAKYTLSLTDSYTALYIVKKNSTTDKIEPVGNSSNVNAYQEWWSDGSQSHAVSTVNTSAGLDVSANITVNNTNLTLFGLFIACNSNANCTGITKSVYQNSTSVSSGCSSGSTPKSTWDRVGFGDNTYMNGNLFEILIWPSYRSEELFITSNIKGYYGL